MSLTKNVNCFKRFDKTKSPVQNIPKQRTSCSKQEEQQRCSFSYSSSSLGIMMNEQTKPRNHKRPFLCRCQCCVHAARRQRSCQKRHRKTYERRTTSNKLAAAASYSQPYRVYINCLINGSHTKALLRVLKKSATLIKSYCKSFFPLIFSISL